MKKPPKRESTVIAELPDGSWELVRIVIHGAYVIFGIDRSGCHGPFLLRGDDIVWL